MASNEVETTHKEKVEMYNLISKDKLIEMLIEANRHLKNLTIPIVSKAFYCTHCAKPLRTSKHTIQPLCECVG